MCAFLIVCLLGLAPFILACPLNRMFQDTEAAPAPAGDMSSTSSQVLVSEDEHKEDLETTADGEAIVKEYFCGIWRCRPKWLQIFRSSKFFTFIMCLYSIIEGAIVTG